MQLRQIDKTSLPACKAEDEMGTGKRVGTLIRVWTLGLALLISFTPTAGQQARPTARDAARAGVAERAVTPLDPVSLVTEFDVNGLKVLVKRRAGTQTVVAGLFIKGGVRNSTPDKGGVENLMLDTASEATVSFPRERLRMELSRMGTTIGSGVNFDYSGLTMASTRANFDRSWEIFTDVALRPSFTVDDVERVRNRMVASLRDDNDTPDSYLQVLQARCLRRSSLSQRPTWDSRIRVAPDLRGSPGIPQAGDGDVAAVAYRGGRPRPPDVTHSHCRELR